MTGNFFRWTVARSWAALTLSGVAAIAPAQTPKSDEVSGKLKFVLVLTRHGVRSPTGSAEQLNQYSAQPWPKWEVPPGNLTPQGAKLMTIFGGYYRSYFAQQGLWSSDGCGDAAHLSIYEDSDERTVETGKALATGIFPGCSAAEQPLQHALREGQADPLFHSLAAGIGAPDHARAAAAISGRVGGDLDGIAAAYRPQLEALQRILLGCPPEAPCPAPGHSAAKPLLAIPASLDGGKGDHLAELKGPLNTASTVTENLLLEYTDGLPMEQVGWGRVDLETLKRLIDLHTAASDLTRRTPYLATVQASNLLARILDTLRQAETGKPVQGALGKPGDRAIFLVGHDTNLTNIAGMLQLNWLVDDRRDDTPPGGALIFELRQDPKSGADRIRAYYTAQTLRQMREATQLTLQAPPARANVFIPGCSESASGFPCDWKAFERTAAAAIDPGFVQ